jgi:hypothetical protein
MGKKLREEAEYLLNGGVIYVPSKRRKSKFDPSAYRIVPPEQIPALAAQLPPTHTLLIVVWKCGAGVVLAVRHADLPPPPWWFEDCYYQLRKRRP